MYFSTSTVVLFFQSFERMVTQQPETERMVTLVYWEEASEPSTRPQLSYSPHSSESILLATIMLVSLFGPVILLYFSFASFWEGERKPSNPWEPFWEQGGEVNEVEMALQGPSDFYMTVWLGKKLRACFLQKLAGRTEVWNLEYFLNFHDIDPIFPHKFLLNGQRMWC